MLHFLLAITTIIGASNWCLAQTAPHEEAASFIQKVAQERLAFHQYVGAMCRTTETPSDLFKEITGQEITGDVANFYETNAKRIAMYRHIIDGMARKQDATHLRIFVHWHILDETAREGQHITLATREVEFLQDIEILLTRMPSHVFTNMAMNEFVLESVPVDGTSWLNSFLNTKKRVTVRTCFDKESEAYRLSSQLLQKCFAKPTFEKPGGPLSQNNTMLKAFPQVNDQNLLDWIQRRVTFFQHILNSQTLRPENTSTVTLPKPKGLTLLCIENFIPDLTPILKTSSTNPPAPDVDQKAREQQEWLDVFSSGRCESYYDVSHQIKKLLGFTVTKQNNGLVLLTYPGSTKPYFMHKPFRNSYFWYGRLASILKATGCMPYDKQIITPDVLAVWQGMPFHSEEAIP